MSTRFELTPRNAASYLRDRGLLPHGVEPAVTPLAGGISNVVLGVAWDDRAVVVKQSLPVLRVAERWEFNPARILVERDCMVALGELLPPGSVPEVLDSDDERFTFTMSRAPSGGVVWKQALLGGDIHEHAPRWAGELLGRVHRGSAGNPELEKRFADLMPLREGRIQPYHEATARANPDLADLIEADVHRLLTRRKCLVLGDFSPKNVLVYPDRLMLLDFEVAHWGDPAFDVAFLLTHLVLKAVHKRSTAYLDAARTFWRGYRGNAEEPDVVTELGVLLLCRIDGKSKIEYLDAENRDKVRQLARALLQDRERRLDPVLDAIGRKLNGPH